MPFGRLSIEQAVAVRPWVLDRDVWDLGAGDCLTSVLLLGLGARHVTAVDGELEGVSPLPGITMSSSLFKDISVAIDVAFLSWPSNYLQPGLVSLLRRARVVVYLGSNVDLTACGHPTLFEYFTSRDLVCHIPRPRNTLLVLGKPLDTRRPPTGEEYAGMNNRIGGEILSFAESQLRTR